MDGFEVGVAVRDITPPPGALLWGYSDRTGSATGTLDPLFAKAVTFRVGRKTACVVSLDLGRVPLVEVCDHIRARVDPCGVDHVLFSATHTHHAPVMEFSNAPHVSRIETGIVEAIEASVAALQPARIGIGHTTFDIGHNRRLMTEDGRCLMLWRNEARRPTSPVDQEATLIRLDALDGTPLAFLVHFACHPVVMGPSNLQYSADYVGEMARLVCERTGAECIFLQGGAGDINPYLDKTPIDSGGVEAMHQTGRVCAEAVLSTFGSIRTEIPKHPSVRFIREMVWVGTRWDFDDGVTGVTWLMAHGWMRNFIKAYKGLHRSDLSVPASVLLLNGELALAGVPGEFFVDFQLDLKATAPVRTALLCGYADDFHLYFPTIRGALAGGYGGTVASYVGLGAGETVLARLKSMIAGLTNKAQQHCHAGDFVIEDAIDFSDVPLGPCTG